MLKNLRGVGGGDRCKVRGTSEVPRTLAKILASYAQDAVYNRGLFALVGFAGASGGAG